MSASSSRARRAAAVSVVTNGLPVPPARMTMRPFSRWRVARRRMYGSATVSMRMAVCRRVSQSQAFQGVLQGQAVEHGGQHAHVVGGGLLDDLAAGAELGAAEDVAGADDDGQLHAALHDALGLPGDAQRLVDADAALAGLPRGRSLRRSASG